MNTTPKREPGHLATKVRKLADERESAAFQSLKPKRAAKAPQRADGRSPRVIHHANTALSEGHSLALAHEAFRRHTSGEHNRQDKGRVLRDVLDFWIENRDAFDAWIAKRDSGRHRE